uniref:uncharacterized protein LOC117610668 n=1 Tax=Osmia lignaria TaxID=473952 RepID=UPI0014796CFD|nr:uncharacterized protein LOC117610668 [Osmia lignaria]
MATASTHDSGSDQLPTIRLMKNKRRTFKAQITIIGKSLETYQDSTKERDSTKLQRQFEGFNEIQDEMVTAITLLQEAEQSTTQHPSTAPRTANKSPASSTSSAAIGLHLPKIDLPKFDGRLEKWIVFKDAFQTIIHAHPGLNDIQKLHYLRLSLSGKAESAIESFTISEDNYKTACTN